jgi:1-phosphofructokinase
MITTVTLNPAIDKTLTLDNLSVGTVNRVVSVVETIGGKGVNVAKVLHILGIDTMALGLVGKQNFDIIEGLFEKEKIVRSFIEVAGKTRTNTKIIDMTNRQTTELNEPGFGVKVSDMRKLEERLKLWTMKSDYVVLSGSLPIGLDPDTYRTIILDHPACEFVLDTDGEALAEGIKAHPFLIKPNLEELNHAFKKELKTEEEIVAFSQTLLQTYDIGMILLSLGKEGSLLITEDVVYRASPLHVDVISTVGAGDALLAGFLCGLSKNLALDECLRMANVCGALMCARQRDEFFDYGDVVERMHEIEVRIV